MYHYLATLRIYECHQQLFFVEQEDPLQHLLVLPNQHLAALTSDQVSLTISSHQSQHYNSDAHSAGYHLELQVLHPIYTSVKK